MDIQLKDFIIHHYQNYHSAKYILCGCTALFTVCLLYNLFKITTLPNHFVVPKSPHIEIKKPMHYQNIASMHLFGISPDTEHSNQTLAQLGLKLIGVLSTGKAGSAIIAGQDGKGKIYRLGNYLPGNAKIVEIHADRVLVELNNHIEALKLPFKTAYMKKS